MKNARENLEPTFRNSKVVKSPAEICTADLRDLEPPALRSVFERNVLQRYDSMSETVQLQVVAWRRLIVEKQDS